MISTQRNTPEVYYNESRDFQALGRLFDIIFNYLKTSTDTVKNNPISDKSDIKLIDLATRTLGFESKREYDVNDLYVLCNGFKSIMMLKGSKKAIEDCVRILLKAQNIDKSFLVDIDNKELAGDYRREVNIFIPIEVKDIALLEDMLDYILPTGYLFSITMAEPYGGEGWRFEVYSEDDVQSSKFESNETGVIVGEIDSGNRVNVDLRPSAKLSDSELEIADKGIVDNTLTVEIDNE